MSADVKLLFLKVAHGQPLLNSPSVTAVAGQGLEGDVSYGKSRRQVLLIDHETLEQYALSPGDVRENITTSGIDLHDLPTESRLRVGEALLELTGTCEPCGQLDELRAGLQDEIRGRRGVLARVLESGTISIGDQVAVELPAAETQPPVQRRIDR